MHALLSRLTGRVGASEGGGPGLILMGDTIVYSSVGSSSPTIRFATPGRQTHIIHATSCRADSRTHTTTLALDQSTPCSYSRHARLASFLSTGEFSIFCRPTRTDCFFPHSHLPPLAQNRENCTYHSSRILLPHYVDTLRGVRITYLQPLRTRESETCTNVIIVHLVPTHFNHSFTLSWNTERLEGGAGLLCPRISPT